MKQKLIKYINAGFPALSIRTAEEGRALKVIVDVASDLKRNVYTWTASHGLEQVASNNESAISGINNGSVEQTDNPKAAADHLVNQEVDPKQKLGIVVFCDLHSWLPNLDAYTERAIKDLLRVAPSRGMLVIFLGPDLRPPPTWEKNITMLDFSLPNAQELDFILDHIEKAAAESKTKLMALSNGERDAVVRAASGLTAPEAENAFALGLIEGGNRVLASTVAREKANAVKRSGLMEIIQPEALGLDALGGMDLLKAWLLQRRNAYSKKAKEYGLPSPRGVLLAGLPGCGKSLAAKCVGTVFGIPTIRLDIGCLLAGIVGESEARTRVALATAEAVAPCVLWIDEVNRPFGLLAA